MFDKYRMDLNKLRQRVAAKLPGITYGFVNNERRQRTPYVIECMGLAREDLGDVVFKREYHRRRVWCVHQCSHGHEIEPMRDAMMQVVGYSYRFASCSDAALFKTLFV